MSQVMKMKNPQNRINVNFINDYGLNEMGLDYGAMFKEFVISVC